MSQSNDTTIGQPAGESLAKRGLRIATYLAIVLVVGSFCHAATFKWKLEVIDAVETDPQPQSVGYPGFASDPLPPPPAVGDPLESESVDDSSAPAGDSTLGLPAVQPISDVLISNQSGLGDSAETGDRETFTAIEAARPPALVGIACLSSDQLLVSFEFGQTVAGDYTASVGDQLLSRTPVLDQPTRLYFLGIPPAQDTPLTILLTSQPEGATAFSGTYIVPACRPPAPTAAAPRQPNCAPPEFFDPLMNRCRIAANEPTAEPETAHSAPPKSTPAPEPTATEPTPTEPTPTEPTPTEPTPTEPSPTPTEPTPTPPTPTGTPCDC